MHLLMQVKKIVFNVFPRLSSSAITIGCDMEFHSLIPSWVKKCFQLTQVAPPPPNVVLIYRCTYFFNAFPRLSSRPGAITATCGKEFHRLLNKMGKIRISSWPNTHTHAKYSFIDAPN